MKKLFATAVIAAAIAVVARALFMSFLLLVHGSPADGR